MYTIIIICILFCLLNYSENKVVKKLSETNYYRPFFKNGRVLGGMVGHWKEDFSKGQSERDNAKSYATVPAGANPNVTITFFTQKLDHFNGADSRTWKQVTESKKYWVNTGFRKPGGPVFLMLGGEGPTSRHWIDTNEGISDWLKNAQIFGALCFQLEHRFYGDSYPLPDMSVSNLRYLSSRQALADAANFIRGMNAEYNLPQETKWITFGGSYSGALSAWFRLKYPHLLVGAVGSSAPFLAQLDFRQYMEVVKHSLDSYSSQCTNAIRMGDMAVQQLMQTPSGQQTLKKKLRLCNSLKEATQWDIMNLYNNLAGNFMGAVQYSMDNRGIYANTVTIPALCRLMLNPSMPNVIDRYAAVNKLILDTSGEECLDYNYANMVKFLQQTNFTSGDASWRLWIWQTCTEFGYFQDSNSTMQPFANHFPLSFFIKQCTDLFGSEFTKSVISENIKITNNYYGGMDYRGTNVILPNGSIDPWHALSILKNIGPTTKAAYVLGTAHCADMYPPRQADIIGLRFARKEITEALRTWLNQNS